MKCFNEYYDDATCDAWEGAGKCTDRASKQFLDQKCAKACKTCNPKGGSGGTDGKGGTTDGKGGTTDGKGGTTDGKGGTTGGKGGTTDGKGGTTGGKGGTTDGKGGTTDGKGGTSGGKGGTTGGKGCGTGKGSGQFEYIYTSIWFTPLLHIAVSDLNILTMTFTY